MAMVQCCETHDGPHLHGCARPRHGDHEHAGACLLGDIVAGQPGDQGAPLV